MRKIPLGIMALYFNLAVSFAQTTDSSSYKARKLKVEEVNFVSGYYQQNGNNSAVTGGIGTEALTDIANTLELKVSKLNVTGNTHHLSLECGIDYYTSASSDNINPFPVKERNGSYQLSGPSRHDVRVYPSLSWSVQNDKRHLNYGAGISYSHEYDYSSKGLNLSFSKSSKNYNREFGIKLLAFLDQWTVIYPFELRPVGYGSGSQRDSLPVDTKPRNSFQATFTLSQVVNKRMQVALIFDPSYMQGQLTTLYQRVYLNDGEERVEKLPDKRLKIAAGLRVNYFLGDRFVIRSFYRIYHDNWGNTAHTASIEIPIKLSAFYSLIPYYRFNSQSGITYFAPINKHSPGETYYTSDYDLSGFTSHFIGMGIRIVPSKGVLHIKYFNSFEFRYGHYIRNTGTGLLADIVTMAFKFK